MVGEEDYCLHSRLLDVRCRIVLNDQLNQVVSTWVITGARGDGGKSIQFPRKHVILADCTIRGITSAQLPRARWSGPES